MQVTLVQTRKTLDLNRQLDDGTLEKVGSYEISISDPTFIKRSEQLIAEIDERGYDDLDFDYGDLAEKARALLNISIVGGQKAVNEIIGEGVDFYNSLLLLTAVMQTVNVLNPGRQYLNQMNELVPDAEQLYKEAMAAKANRSRGKAKR